MKMSFIVVVVLLAIFSAVRGQSGIPQGVVTRCYSTSGDCSGPEDDDLCQLFDRTVAGDLNHCCYLNETTLRSNPGNRSFTLNGGTCKRCNDTSVFNSMSSVQCYAVCTPDSLGSFTGTGQQDGQDSMTIDVTNDCCSGATSTQGYTDTGFNGSPSAPCTLCHEIGSDATVGCDPHFFLPLANGDHMCFSIQGEPDFAFNLISDKYIKLNGQFVLPAEEESHTIANVSTFLGDLGLVITNRKTNSSTVIKVSAVDHSVLVGNSLTIVKDRPVTVNVFDKITISVDAHVQTKRLKDESAWLYISTDGFGIKVRFYKKHLDMFLTKTNGLTKDAHGLIGQFLTADVQIDTKNMLMQLGDRKPISVKRDKAWRFLGIDEECWYGATTDNQGTGIIEGVYINYVVEHLI